MQQPPLGMARILSKEEIFAALLAGTRLADFDQRFKYVLKPDTAYNAEFFVNLEHPETWDNLYISLEDEGKSEITFQVSCSASSLLLLDDGAYELFTKFEEVWASSGSIIKLTA